MRLFAGLSLAIFSFGISAHTQSSPATSPFNHIQPGALNTICGTPLKSPDGNHPSASPQNKCVTVFIPGCPVNMHVSQGLGGGMLAAGENGMQRRVFAPRLRLFLNDLRPGTSDRIIASATVTVQGSTSRDHIQRLNGVPASAPESTPDSIARTLSLELSTSEEGAAEGEFRLPGFAFATRIDLESVTYDDGSTWKLTGTESCRVAPDLLMLINH